MSAMRRWERLTALAQRERQVPASPPTGFAFAVLSRAAAARREAESTDAVRLIFRSAIAASIAAILLGAWNWRAVADEIAAPPQDQIVEVTVEPGL